jgi:molybdopterin synthase catalytic subunit
VIFTALSDEPLHTDAIVARVASPDAGAVVVFEGRTRAEGDLRRLSYEAFVERAAKQLETFAGDIARRDGVRGVAAVHRTGDVDVGDVSVVVVVCAAHRAEAFDGARGLIDRIKTEAAIWKKEVYADREAWVTSQWSDGAYRSR